MANTKQMLLIVVIAVVLIWFVLPMLNCNNKEHLTLCDENGCRDAQDIQNETGLIVAQDSSNIRKAYEADEFNNEENEGDIVTDMIVDPRVENASLLNSQCSPDCCDKQWPTPFNVKRDPSVCGKDFVPSNYTCNNSWNNAGCLCMTRDASDVLNNRGLFPNA